MEDVAKSVDFGWRDFEPFIINEPEAVAAYLLESMDPYDALKGENITPPKVCSVVFFCVSLSSTIVPNLVFKQKGQTFIVCDAGGGTVVCTLPA